MSKTCYPITAAARRKNQLLAFYDEIQPILAGCGGAAAAAAGNKYRDYYFMAQFEVGQQELVAVHHYTYMLDMCSMISESAPSKDAFARIRAVNAVLLEHVHFSTQRHSDYDKIMSKKDFTRSKKFV